MNYVSADSISISLDDQEDIKFSPTSQTITVTPLTQTHQHQHNLHQQQPTISNSNAATASSSQSTSSATVSRSRAKKIKPPKPIPLSLDGYWPSVTEEINQIKQVDAKNQNLPLARIKKIMKLDENAKMIAAEAPLLFAKACEYFIQELTLRAWVHTEENKRRTLQRSDIATAIARCDQFDFLIDIVPREEVKPNTHHHSSSSTNNSSSHSSSRKATETETSKSASSSTTAAASTSGTLNNVTTTPATSTITNTNNDPIHYYLQLGSGGQSPQITLQQNPQTTVTGHHPTIINQSIPANQAITQLNVMAATPQNILLNTQQTLVNTLQQQQQQPQQQQLQLFQQILTQNGEIQNVPITLTPNNLNLLRMQMQGNVTGQPQQQQLIIQQQQPQLVQVTGATATGQSNQNPGIFLNQTTLQQTTDKQGNIVNNFRTN